MPSNVIDSLIEIVGAKAVLNADAEMAPFMSDWHDRYHGAAHAVVLPTTTNEVSQIMAFAEAKNIVVVPQGGNTGFMGGATPDETGNTILLSLRRMNAVREIDTQNMSMTVEAGCILQNLHDIIICIVCDCHNFFPGSLHKSHCRFRQRSVFKPHQKFVCIVRINSSISTIANRSLRLQNLFPSRLECVHPEQLDGRTSQILHLY